MAAVSLTTGAGATLPRQARPSTDQGAVPAQFGDLLTGVSRTFALSIPELPSPLDEWVTCAYLVCRIIDTLEDRPGGDERERQQQFDDVIAALGPPVDVSNVGRLVRSHPKREAQAGSPGDDPWAGSPSHETRAGSPSHGPCHAPSDPCGQLMTMSPEVFDWLAGFPEPAIDAVRRCAVEMIYGLRRTPLPSIAAVEGRAVFLFERVRELERYCHYAAGVVGMMLTRLFSAHLGPDLLPADRARLHAGKRFGRGLQLTNIIKDHPADLRDGRCFIPREALARFELTPADLLRPHLPDALRRWIVDRAAAHLSVAVDYTLSVPPTAAGVRRFCIQPLMMAVLTLQRVLSHPDITPDDRPKITREQVADVIGTSRQIDRDDRAIRSWFDEHAVQ